MRKKIKHNPKLEDLIADGDNSISSGDLEDVLDKKDNQIANEIRSLASRKSTKNFDHIFSSGKEADKTSEGDNQKDELGQVIKQQKQASVSLDDSSLKN